MKEEEMMEIADLIHRALESQENPPKLDTIQDEVRSLTRRFPLPG
jgi:glycine/serine hydroxymethyltransferase